MSKKQPRKKPVYQPTSTRQLGESMSLITDIMEHPLDRSYQDAADRKKAQGKPQSSGLRSPLLVVVTTIIGFGLATSAMALTAPSTTAQQNHDRLVKRVEAGTARVEDRSGKVAALNKEISGLQKSALSKANRDDLQRALGEQETLTGVSAVRGRGVVLTVDDAKTAETDAQVDPRTGSSSGGRLTSTDLQVIVNGLWQAGAEGVSINGQRVTALTAIRFAGEAILVNFRPLMPPYQISAVGPGDLKAEFESNAGGNYLANLVDTFDIRSSLNSEDVVRLPAGPTVKLRYARTTGSEQDTEEKK